MAVTDSIEQRRNRTERAGRKLEAKMARTMGPKQKAGVKAAFKAARASLKTTKRMGKPICTICGKPIGGFPGPNTTTHRACRPEVQANAAKTGGRVSLRRALKMPCYYCTDPIASGDHTHCAERLKQVYLLPGEGKAHQRHPIEALLSMRAIAKLERRATKKPVKTCPVCQTEHQKKGPFCSTVHSSAFGRWVRAGKARITKSGEYQIDPDALRRLRSGPGGVERNRG